MSGYKFIYFACKGKLQPIRYLLEDNAVPYEEVRVTKEEWSNLKPNMIFGQLPCFKKGDMELVQSGAILRYLAREHGLYGNTSEEAARIDMIHDGSFDLRQKLVKVSYTPEDKFEEAKKEYIKNIPTELARFEKLLKMNNGGDVFFVGNQISYCDYSLLDNLTNHEIVQPGCLDDHPKLKAFVARMTSRERIAKYIAGDDFKSLSITARGKL